MMKPLINFLVWVAVTVGTGSMAAVYGQGVTTPGTRGRTDPVQRELQRRFESEAIEQALAGRPRRPSDQKHQIILAQIKEDFLQIQIINDDLKQKTSSVQQPDFRSVASLAAEIRRRGARLKDNLSLPKTSATFALRVAGDDSKVNQLQSLVLSLSDSINHFVENPIFVSAKVIDARLSEQASRDLRQIIEVSKQIRKLSEKLDQKH